MLASCQCSLSFYAPSPEQTVTVLPLTSGLRLTMERWGLVGFPPGFETGLPWSHHTPRVHSTAGSGTLPNQPLSIADTANPFSPATPESRAAQCRPAVADSSLR